MQLSPPVSALLNTLERHSGRPFGRREDTGAILELAYRHGRERDLDRLSFLAKFLVRCMGIMKRIGRDGDGYDRLAAEFGASIEQTRTLLASLLLGAPPEVRNRLHNEYLAMTPGAMENMLAFLQDLSSFKNWRIDHPGTPAWENPAP
jgi:hypothetical protein